MIDDIDDEGDRIANHILCCARDRRQGHLAASATSSPKCDVAINILSQLTPDSIVTVTLDSDDPGINTSLEHRWTLVPRWTAHAPTLSFPGAALPPAPAAAVPGQRRSGKARRVPCSMVVDAQGLERVQGFGSVREHRARQALIIGQDYSGTGVKGIGDATARAGVLSATLTCGWDETNVQPMRDAINRDLAFLWSTAKVNVRRRTALGVRKLGGPINLDDHVLARLARGLAALTDIGAPKYNMDADPTPCAREPLQHGFPAHRAYGGPKRFSLPRPRVAGAPANQAPPQHFSHTNLRLDNRLRPARNDALPRPSRSTPLGPVIHPPESQRTKIHTKRKHPSALAVRPRGPGPSIVVAAFEARAEPPGSSSTRRTATTASTSAAAAVPTPAAAAPPAVPAPTAAEAQDDGEDAGDGDDEAGGAGGGQGGQAARLRHLDKFYAGASSSVVEVASIERCLDQQAITFRGAPPAAGQPVKNAQRFSGSARRTNRYLGARIFDPPREKHPASAAPRPIKAQLPLHTRLRPVAHSLSLIHFVLRSSIPFVFHAWDAWVNNHLWGVTGSASEINFTTCAEKTLDRDGIATVLAHIALAGSNPRTGGGPIQRVIARTTVRLDEDVSLFCAPAQTIPH